MELLMAKKPNKTLTIIFLFSLVVHFALLIKNVEWHIPKISDNASEPKPLVIKIKSPRNNDIKQIVRTSESKDKLVSASEYLSEKTNTFDRQTTAQNNGKFKRAGIGYKNGSAQATQNQKKQSKKKHKRVASLKDLSISPSMDFGELEKERKRQQAQKGLKNGAANERGLAANNDYLENVPLGDFTQLNTQEYKYFGFYNRIRERLENFWGTSVKAKSEELFKSGRRFPASENYVTSLVITIDTNGVIQDVKVKSSSGVKELDDAATESFNKAGPFPNPPKELVRNGKAVIEWGFVVKS